jgi:diguanylate cyclase (GGDEF)-like protein/PAS domain S-box-containing protein
MGILQSYAHRPLFIAAVKNKDLAGVHRHLSDLKKNAEIDLTFVTDTRGILWANFPVFPEAIGKDLSSRDWYKGISSHWKPYISTVFKLIVGDKPLAVAVCVPIFDEKERVIGILGNSHRLGFLVNAMQRVPFSPYTTVNVIDRTGQILYSNKFPYRENITDYRFFPILEPALKEIKQQIEMNDPQKDQEKSYLTVVPMGDIGWTVIIERSLRDIYRSEFRRFIEIGAISFLLFLLITFFLVYLRKVSLFRKTEELLQAETKLRQGDEKLRALSSRQKAILAAVPEIIMEVDNNKVYTWANQAGMDFFGEDVVGKEAAFYFEGDQDTYSTVQLLFNGDENMIRIESRQRRKDGEKRLLSWRCRVLKDDNGRVIGALSSARDITDRKRMEEALRESEERHRALVENASDIVFRTDDTGHFTFINPAALRITGYEEKEIIGRHYPTLIRQDMREEAMKFFGRQFVKGIPNTYSEYPIMVKDGREIWFGQNTQLIFQDGKVMAFQAVARDITERKQMEEALKESEKRYRELSIVDDLTQLYNSRHFYFQLKIELDRSNRYEQPLTLLLLDLDNFKAFNDAYGHIEGDQVLLRLGQVVKRCLRQTDSAYRYGGEEFTILLPMTTGKDGAVTAERIRTEFKKEHFSLAPGQDVHVTVSIGLGQYKPQEDMKAFVHRVDQLMYQGKKNGKDRVCY